MTGRKKMVCHTEKLHGGLLNQGSTVTTAVDGSVPINPQNLIVACQKTNNEFQDRSFNKQILMFLFQKLVQNE